MGQNIGGFCACVSPPCSYLVEILLTFYADYSAPSAAASAGSSSPSTLVEGSKCRWKHHADNNCLKDGGLWYWSHHVLDRGNEDCVCQLSRKCRGCRSNGCSSGCNPCWSDFAVKN